MDEIKKIGVVGEGKMGTSVFLFLNGFDFRLTWLCSSDQEREKTQKTVARKTKMLFQCGVLTEQEYTLKTELTNVTASVNDLHDCDLIIEAITENIVLKKELFKSLDETVNQNCIFCSNSSSIIPSLLFPSESRKDKFCGLHFFFPVPMKNMVELIINSAISSHTKDLLLTFLKRINKKPFIQDEENAFILNKLFLDFQAGAYNIFLEGILSYKEIDDIIKERLFPIGVFEFFDHVGIDTMLSSVKTYSRNSENIEYYSPLIKKLEELVLANRLGLKTKSGFYNYDNSLIENIDNKPINSDLENAKQEALVTLKNYFYKSVRNVINLKICSPEELRLAVKDYMGIDHDPFPSDVNFAHK